MTLVLAFGLTVVEHKKNYLSSNVLLVYWLLFIFSSSIKLRTLTFGCPLSILSDKKDLQVTVCLLTGKIADALLVFILECFSKDPGVQLGDDSFVSVLPLSPPISIPDCHCHPRSQPTPKTAFLFLWLQRFYVMVLLVLLLCGQFSLGEKERG